MLQSPAHHFSRFFYGPRRSPTSTEMRQRANTLPPDGGYHVPTLSHVATSRRNQGCSVQWPQVPSIISPSKVLLLMQLRHVTQRYSDHFCRLSAPLHALLGALQCLKKAGPIEVEAARRLACLRGPRSHASSPSYANGDLSISSVHAS